MAKQMRWEGERWKAALAYEARRRNQACAIAVHNRAKVLVGTEGAGSRVRIAGSGGRGAGGRYVAGATQVVQGRAGRKQVGKLLYGAFPSNPGDPPHKQTGRLQSSIAWELVSDLVARVGTNVRYGRWLELGTRRTAARPWLRRALREMQPFIVRVWNRPWRLAA